MAGTNLSRANGSGSATTKFTFSAWLKYSGFVTGGQRFFSSTGGSGDTYFRFNSGGEMEFSGHNSAATSFGYFITNRKFRDHNAWYHIVIKVDTTQSTQTDRVKLYVNGVDEAGVGGYSTGTYPNQNATDNISLSTNTHYIGGAASSQYFNGLMTHIHYSDGYAYDASTFGETDSTSGIWKPKTNPSLTYGTNGYFLKMENSAAMGTDSSGNTNTFSVANGTLTQNVDTPSNNFATLNSLINNNNGTFSNGNLTLATTTSTRDNAPATIGVSQGKWYAEVKVIAQSANRFVWGISSDPSELARADTFAGNQTDSVAYLSDGEVYNSGSNSAYGATYAAGDIIGIALDLDNNKVYFHKNGTYQNSGVPTSGSTGTGAVSITSASSVATGYYFITMGDTSGVHNVTGSVNFGQGFFGTTAVSSANADDGGLGAMEYDVPANYRVLCTKNIKDYG